jgi:hypothetical protein
MGRQSAFTPAQKRDAVLAVLSKRKKVAEACRELGGASTDDVERSNVGEPVPRRSTAASADDLVCAGAPPAGVRT